MVESVERAALCAGLRPVVYPLHEESLVYEESLNTPVRFRNSEINPSLNNPEQCKCVQTSSLGRINY